MQPPHRTQVVIGTALASFLSALDSTILSTAMPTIVSDLGGLAIYSWVFSVYMLVAAVSMPLWGKLSDVKGKKRVFFTAIGLFLLGSILCGIAQDMAQLIFSRGLQGIGAGGLASVPFTMISSVFPVEERGKALGFLTSTWGIASVIGPAVGSFLIVQFDWRWVFFVNIPVGMAAIIIVGSYFLEEKAVHRKEIDYSGALFLCITIVSLLLVVLWIGKGAEVFSVAVTGMIFVFCISLALFIRRETRCVDPIIRLGFFRRRAFWLGNLLGFMASFAAFGVIAYMPLLVQTSPGGSAVAAGIVITAMSLSWSGASILSGRIVYQLGEKRMIGAGMAAMTVGFAMIILNGSDASLLARSLSVIVIGLGMGCQTPGLLLSVQHSLELTDMGVATSTHMLARTIGAAMGVGIMGSIVVGTMLGRFNDLIARGVLSHLPPEAQAHLGEPQELLSARIQALMSSTDQGHVLSAFASSVQQTFWMGLIVGVAGVVLSLLLPPSSLKRIHSQQQT